MNKKWPALLLFLLVISLGYPFGNAASAAAAGSELTYVTSFGADASLSGEKVSKQIYFSIPDYWKVQKTTVKLDYRVSQILENQRSSVTLSVNGTSFYSFRPAAGEGEQQLNVQVPSNLLKEDSNVLEVTGYLREETQNDVCTTEPSPDQWLNIYGTSSVAVTHTNKEMTAEIREFNKRFTAIDNASGGRSAVAVPEGADPAELEAASYALSGYAGGSDLGSGALPLIPYTSDQLQGKFLVLLVSTYEHLPADIKAKIGSSQLSNSAVIQLIHPDHQPTLVVTSANKELLVKAGRMAANLSLMSQLDTDKIVVDADTAVDTPPVDINRIVPLTDSGDQLTGSGHQEQTYYISMPANRSIAGAGKVSVSFRYAENLDFERSLMTVLVNGKPIGSKKLSEELAGGDKAVFPIPSNIDVAGNFSLTVAFDLELENAYCSGSGGQMPWAFITKDSALQLSSKDRTEMLFNNYPYPFLRDGSFNHVAVVLPEKADAATYSTIGNLFSLLGKYAEGNNGGIEFFNDNADKNQLKNSNLIVIGTYRDNKLIQLYNKNLYFKFNDEGTAIASNEKIRITETYGKRIGVIQLVPSPWNDANGMMVLTGASSAYYELASRLAANEANKYKLYGDGVLTDKDGNVQAFRFKKEAGGSDESLVKDILQRSDVVGFMAAVVTVACLVIVSLILLIRKHSRRQKNRQRSRQQTRSKRRGGK
ncbi:cellulose biosynthesis cyclic di-GMP-binding regulatory protein BcsB [Paenibacillus physcomitrellae]|uniref:Glycosyl transferase n=1 Tax=Paenibacillus physcomitrellae TaxID=1619311 RepID=A0ABQ1FZU8_9BACL|nr:cellulose biosynthesis cyclic di-GMP-binding regulatory protein BcsB [Paenibacillus physcomitrellae]GGA33255.1 glycosyl transferase [Paenibacillus physcomitrellae]